jgi:uncharacterized HAD superfamily protein
MSGDRRIYVDFDDVLCETARAFLSLLRRNHGRTVAFERILSFDLGRSLGLEPGEARELMRQLHTREMLVSIEPVDGAVPVLTRWAEAGCTICVVTGRPPFTDTASREWLEANGVPYDSLTFVDKYSRNHAASGGVRALDLREFGCREFCLAIEDSPSMAGFLAREMNVPVVIFDRPWNADAPVVRAAGEAGIRRCSTWREIVSNYPCPGSESPRVGDEHSYEIVGAVDPDGGADVGEGVG